jgi:ribonuclease D
METYARNDTRYLFPLAEILRSQLRDKGRLPWLEEVCARLIQECSIPRAPDPDRVWRVKGADRLSSRALAILREIWQWREEEAKRANKPPYFILSHELLVGLSAAAAQKGKVDGLPPLRLSASRRDRLEAALSKGLCLSPSEFPAHVRAVGYRLSKIEQQRFQELRKRRDLQASRLGLDPTLIASKTTLVDLARDWARESAKLMSWQRELLAAE